MCIAVELKSRPTIRVVSRLYSETTKPCPIANEKALTSWSYRSNEFLGPVEFDDSKWREKALTSWSNRSNEFLGPVEFDDSKWRAGGTQLFTKTELSECRFRGVRMSEIRCTWLTQDL